MLRAFPFLANRPFLAPLNLNGLRGFCKPECGVAAEDGTPRWPPMGIS
jgi:hypothetical protein